MDRNTSQKYSIGILGYGFVGRVLHKYYPDALTYDSIDGDTDRLGTVLSQDVVFITFNLKDNGIGSYEDVATYMRQAPEDRIFIIKSTFVPGTTDKLQEEFPQHRVMYNPEFLTEATAWWDFTRPHIQILGIPHNGLKLAKDMFEILPQAPVTRVVSPVDAEIIKHATNSYYATKVIYFNQLSDATDQLGGDYETVREIMSHDDRIGNSHNIVKHKGYRGYGNIEEGVSKCLPKDVRAFRTVAKMPLLDAVEKLNDGYYKKM